MLIKIESKISKKDMKNLLLLWLEKVYFTFENNLFQQKVGAAMGSPFGPVLAATFMVHLEKTLMPELEKFMKPWKRYIDVIITYIKPFIIADVRDILNKFYENIKVFRKETNSDIYLH